MEFLNFAVLLVVFVLCVSSESSQILTPFPMVGYTDGSRRGLQMRRRAT